jgi:hypothetical protein
MTPSAIFTDVLIGSVCGGSEDPPYILAGSEDPAYNDADRTFRSGMRDDDVGWTFMSGT